MLFSCAAETADLPEIQCITATTKLENLVKLNQTSIKLPPKPKCSIFSKIQIKKQIPYQNFHRIPHSNFHSTITQCQEITHLRFFEEILNWGHCTSSAFNKEFFTKIPKKKGEKKQKYSLLFFFAPQFHFFPSQFPFFGKKENISIIIFFVVQIAEKKFRKKVEKSGETREWRKRDKIEGWVEKIYQFLEN